MADEWMTSNKSGEELAKLRITALRQDSPELSRKAKGEQWLSWIYSLFYVRSEPHEPHTCFLQVLKEF